MGNDINIFSKDVIIKRAKRAKAEMLTNRLAGYKNITVENAFEALSRSITYELLMQNYTELYGGTDELLWKMLKAETDGNMNEFTHLIGDRQ